VWFISVWFISVWFISVWFISVWFFSVWLCARVVGRGLVAGVVTPSIITGARVRWADVGRVSAGMGDGWGMVGSEVEPG
jgi:hypothetical protein